MNNPVIQKPTKEEERRRRNALGVSLTTGVIFLIVSAIVGPIAYRENGLTGLWGIVLTGTVSIVAFFSSFHIFRWRTSLGISILIGTILFLAFTVPVVAHGHGLALSIMVLVVIASISSATLPSEWTTRVVIITFIVSSSIILLDLYLPDFGLPSDPFYTNIIAVIASIGYAFFILRRFNLYTLQTKVITTFTLITIIPLITLGFFYSRSSTQVLEAQSKIQLTNLAKIEADSIDNFISTQIDNVHSDAKQVALIEYLRLPVQARPGSAKELNARLALLSLTRKDPVFIHSIAILDSNGVDVLDTFEEYKGRNESGFSYFIRPVQTGLPYASNIIFQKNGERIYFSAPIKSPNGSIIGVLRSEYHAKVIQSIIRSIDPGNAGTIFALIDINTYARLAFTGDRDKLFKSYKAFDDAEFATLQAEGRLPAGTKENILDGADDTVVAGIDNLQHQPFFSAYSQSLGSDATNTGIYLQTQPWIALVRQSTSTYLAPVKEQNRTTTLLSMILIILSIGVGLFVSQILTSPLLTLTKTAEKLATGDRSARAQANTEDEIGLLATSFNRMAEELNQTFKNLEIRVAERTTDLEIARRQSEKRAGELQSIGEISRVITGEQTLEKLLPLISRLVSERFGFYHTGIFLLDNTNQFVVLRAASSEGGQKMLEREHRLEVGGSGIVGYVAKTGTPRISLDVGQDAVFFNNPDLPGTRSEMALPLKVKNRTVGVLDVQSEKPGAFTEYDINTLSILADQVAIAIENARLFTQSQQALAELQSQYKGQLQESWKTFIRDEEVIGYHQGLMGGKKVTKPIETEEIRQAMNRGEVLVLNGEGKQEAAIVVPIKLRGQIIGTMKIKAPTTNRKWSEDEANLTQAISDRLSLALENARLIQESQRQAINEQRISEITGKIGASINLKSVLQTAVEELGHAIPGSEIIIKFEQKNEDEE